MSIFQSVVLVSKNDRILRFTVKDDALAVVNLTGFTAAIYKITSRVTNKIALLQKTLGGGVTITNATSGLIEVSLSDTDTDTLPAGRYYHELRLTDATNNDVTVMHGDCTVQDSALAT